MLTAAVSATSTTAPTASAGPGSGRIRSLTRLAITLAANVTTAATTAMITISVHGRPISPRY